MKTYCHNPKLIDTPIVDCIPQVGPCPVNCSQCFYNRPGAFYAPIDRPNVPSIYDANTKIVRINCGNDSNVDRDLVIKTAQQYKNYFFNTSICNLDFPGPVVLTANPKEEKAAWMAAVLPPNVMFVRLRVSDTNLKFIDDAIEWYTGDLVPVVLTFMSYYDRNPGPNYEWKIRHINSYYCPTKEFMKSVMARYKGNRLVSMCGSMDESYCRACKNCEIYYWQTMKRMRNE